MSTRGRFGLRALLHLAVCEKNTTISVAKLSKKMGVSSDYLMQLLVQLRQVGIVKSVRGPRGGFRLAKIPAKITVADVVRAVEGPIVVTDCLLHTSQMPRSRGQPLKPCAKRAHCISRLVWQKLSADIAVLLDRVTLQNVIDDARRKGMA
jgi:Rrf2 family protein